MFFFNFYVLSFFKKEDTIQGGTLFKGGHYLRKYGIHGFLNKNEEIRELFKGQNYFWKYGRSP